ncbi:hypothetical protein FJZ31_21570 [Candidatus Poribacteria bacterium]|nr:hypothetical protein [Candidatus Poribacteria bacterium]
MNFYDNLRDEQRLIAGNLKNAFNREKGRKYQIVAQNFEEEHRVPTEIRDRFLDNIDSLLDSGKDVLRAVDSAIEENMLLKAAGIDDVDVPDILSRIMPAQDIIDYHAPNRDDSPAEYSERELIEEIQSGDMSPQKLRGELRGDYEIVWCTFAEAIDNEWQRSNSPDQIRDMLGLYDEAKDEERRYHACSYIVEFRYRKAQVYQSTGDVLRFPTVIEAGSNPAFSPSPHGEKTGLTRHTQTLEPGFPEAVHKPIPANTVDKLIVRGHLKTDPKPPW